MIGCQTQTFEVVIVHQHFPGVQIIGRTMVVNARESQVHALGVVSLAMNLLVVQMLQTSIGMVIHKVMVPKEVKGLRRPT